MELSDLAGEGRAYAVLATCTLESTSTPSPFMKGTIALCCGNTPQIAVPAVTSSAGIENGPADASPGRSPRACHFPSSLTA
jgi:hypothetical protein